MTNNSHFSAHNIFYLTVRNEHTQRGIQSQLIFLDSVFNFRKKPFMFIYDMISYFIWFNISNET